MPLTEYPEPVQLAEFTFTLALLAVNVPVKFLLLPTATLPKLCVVGEVESVPAAVPVPESDTVTLGFKASDVMARLPVAAVAAVGANFTWTVTFAPGAIVIGRLGAELTVKPVPLATSAETWIVAVLLALLLKVRELVLLLPTATLPKLTLAADTASWFGTMPLPVRAIVTEAFPAFEVTVTVPDTAPPVVGAKVTLTFALCPGAMEKGTLGAGLSLNPAPVTLTCDMLIVPVLLALLLNVNEVVFVPFTATLPKSMLVTLALRVIELLPPGLLGAIPVPPAHPANTARPARTGTSKYRFDIRACLPYDDDYL